MLKFSRYHRHYVCTMRYRNVPIQFICDTGVSSTILSVKTICDVSKSNLESLHHFMRVSSGKDYVSVYGETSKVVPCFLRNLVFDELHLDRFMFGVNENTGLNLLGWDFIDACGLQKMSGCDIIVHTFDYDRYVDNFNQIYGSEAQELLFVGDDNVAWFNNLPAEMKDKLHQWSTPLYTVLSLGTYLDEFDGVLDGFKKQYNL